MRVELGQVAEERLDVARPESRGPMGGTSAVDGARGMACEARRGMVGSVAGWWEVQRDLVQRPKKKSSTSIMELRGKMDNSPKMPPYHSLSSPFPLPCRKPVEVGPWGG